MNTFTSLFQLAILRIASLPVVDIEDNVFATWSWREPHPSSPVLLTVNVGRFRGFPALTMP